MKIINRTYNLAEIESIAEYELFYKDKLINIKSNCDDFFQLIYNSKCFITSEQVKEKLQLVENESYFCFYKYIMINHPNYFPSLGTFPYKKSEKNLGNLYLIVVNIITINKTIKELYDLGKWCGLWK